MKINEMGHGDPDKRETGRHAALREPPAGINGGSHYGPSVADAGTKCAKDYTAVNRVQQFVTIYSDRGGEHLAVPRRLSHSTSNHLPATIFDYEDQMINWLINY